MFVSDSINCLLKEFSRNKKQIWEIKKDKQEVK